METSFHDKKFVGAVVGYIALCSRHFLFFSLASATVNRNETCANGTLFMAIVLECFKIFYFSCAWYFTLFLCLDISRICCKNNTYSIHVLKGERKKNSLTDAITYSHMIRYALLHAAADVASTHLKSPNTKNLCCKHFESEKQSEKLFFFTESNQLSRSLIYEHVIVFVEVIRVMCLNFSRISGNGSVKTSTFAISYLDFCRGCIISD